MTINHKVASTTFRIELREGKKVLGGCYIRMRMNYNNPAYLFRMFVSKPHRGKGYGSKILEAAVELYQESGIKLNISSDGPLSNKDLIAWYTRYGFVQTASGTMLLKPKKP